MYRMLKKRGNELALTGTVTRTYIVPDKRVVPRVPHGPRMRGESGTTREEGTLLLPPIAMLHLLGNGCIGYDRFKQSINVRQSSEGADGGFQGMR
jgi:hypothetical protein